jgi:gamma-glutamylcyclotransferase (GGCT)/AIG2-like uncharacterized protein YtfP
VRTPGPTSADVAHVFVYGTLLPGDVRWHLLAPFVVDDGWPDRTSGRLFDTGLDYPAAVFDDTGTAAAPYVVGRTMSLLGSSRTRALDVLDEVEGVVAGLYERVVVRTERGHDAWAYRYGGGLDLTPIVSGDWARHRRPPD